MMRYDKTIAGLIEVIDIKKLEAYAKICEDGNRVHFQKLIKGYTVDDFSVDQLKVIRDIIDTYRFCGLRMPANKFIHPYIPAKVMEAIGDASRTSTEEYKRLIARIPLLKTAHGELGNKLTAEIAYYILLDFKYSYGGMNEGQMKEIRKAYENGVNVFNYIPEDPTTTKGKIKYIRKIIKRNPKMVFIPDATAFGKNQLEKIYDAHRIFSKDLYSDIQNKMTVDLTPAMMEFVKVSMMVDSMREYSKYADSLYDVVSKIDMSRYSDEMLEMICRVIYRIMDVGDMEGDEEAGLIGLKAMLDGKSVREMVDAYNQHYLKAAKSKHAYKLSYSGDDEVK